MFDPLTLLQDARQIGRRRFRQVHVSFLSRLISTAGAN